MARESTRAPGPTHSDKLGAASSTPAPGQLSERPGSHARPHAWTSAHGASGMATSTSEDREGDLLTKDQQAPRGTSKFRVLGPWGVARLGAGLHLRRGDTGGGALAWREARPGGGTKGRGGARVKLGAGCDAGGGGARAAVGEGRGGPGAGPRARFARGPACVLRTLQRLAARPYLGLLFRHGCASAATAGSAAGTGGTGAGESRSLPRRSPAATVAGPRFIPKSRRAGWPRRVTWRRACTMRVPCASGARWPAAIPDGWECVTGRVRHPGARAEPRGRATQGPGHRDPYDMGTSLRGHAGCKGCEAWERDWGRVC